MINYKFLTIAVLQYLISSKTCAFELKLLSHQSNQLSILNHRFKRDSGIIPFRPLFVYRQQQKEKQARWKIIEAEKLLKQQQLKLQKEIQNQQNLVRDNSKDSLNPAKSGSTYRISTTYPTYQTSQTYRGIPTRPANDYYQIYQNDQVNAYNKYPAYDSYLAFAPSYTNQQNPYYDEYDSGYSSRDYS